MWTTAISESPHKSKTLCQGTPGPLYVWVNANGHVSLPAGPTTSADVPDGPPVGLPPLESEKRGLTKGGVGLFVASSTRLSCSESLHMLMFAETLNTPFCQPPFFTLPTPSSTLPPRPAPSVLRDAPGGVESGVGSGRVTYYSAFSGLGLWGLGSQGFALWVLCFFWVSGFRFRV